MTLSFDFPETFPAVPSDFDGLCLIEVPVEDRGPRARWWRDGGSGYTDDVTAAGLFPAADARLRTGRGPHVPVDAAAVLARVGDRLLPLLERVGLHDAVRTEDEAFQRAATLAMRTILVAETPQHHADAFVSAGWVGVGRTWVRAEGGWAIERTADGVLWALFDRERRVRARHVLALELLQMVDTERVPDVEDKPPADPLAMHLPEQYRSEAFAVQAWGVAPEPGSEAGAFVFASKIPGRSIRCIATNGLGWEHVSVSVFQGSRPTMPVWDEMSHVRDLFWPPEATVVQYHPPKSEHVNHAPRTLHLWRPIGQTVVRPPPILVGPLPAEPAG